MVPPLNPEDVLRTWFEQVWSEGRADLIETLMSPHVIGRGAGEAREDVVGREGFVSFYESLRQAFPDIRFTCEAVVASGSLVAGRWTARMTHSGPYSGKEPSGRAISLPGISMMRIENGQIVEAWDEWDRLTLAKETGLIAPTQRPGG